MLRGLMHSWRILHTSCYFEGVTDSKKLCGVCLSLEKFSATTSNSVASLSGRSAMVKLPTSIPSASRHQFHNP
eukprot:6161124-Amphidinium_carterae.1